MRVNHSWRRRLANLCIKQLGEIWQGKDYEYTAKKVKNHYEIYRRHSELDEWLLYTYLVIVDDRVYFNTEGVEKNYERYYDACKRNSDR